MKSFETKELETLKKPFLIVVRDKSSLTDIICSYYGNYTVFILNKNKYFIRPDGVYDYKPKLKQNAADWCMEKFEWFVKNRYSIILEENNHEKYVEKARESGFDVKIIKENVDKSEDLV